MFFHLAFYKMLQAATSKGDTCRKMIQLLDFFGPQMALASLVAISEPKKVSIFRPTHSNALRNINNRYINSYFVSLPNNISWTQQQWWTLCDPPQQSCGVLSS
jgi:hypothetical protein